MSDEEGGYEHQPVLKERRRDIDQGWGWQHDLAAVRAGRALSLGIVRIPIPSRAGGGWERPCAGLTSTTLTQCPFMAQAP